LSTNAPSSPVSGRIASQRWFAITIEASWLTGLVLVPLVFRGRELVVIYSQPKYFLVHLVALVIVVVWTAEWALGPSRNRSISSVFETVDRWVAREPGRWALLAFGGFVFAAVASTLLSPVPLVSLWGRDFEDLGYELYSTLTFLVVLFAIAFRMRTRDQVLRFALAVTGTGTVTALYGLSQHFGWDPIGRGADASRVISSFGNALFFGSYLVMTVAITVAVSVSGHLEGRRWAIPAGAIATGVQLAALWFAGGRGPMLGTIVSLIAFMVIGCIFLDRRILSKVALRIGVGILVAVALIAIPAEAGRGSRGFQDFLDIPGEITDSIGFVFSSTEPLVDQSSVPATTDPDLTVPAEATTDPDLTVPAEATTDPDLTVPAEATTGPDLTVPAEATTGPDLTVPAEATTGPDLTVPAEATVEPVGAIDARGNALSGRAEIWRSAAALIVSREVPFDESGLVTGLRFLFGFGPDMFFYSYPMVTPHKVDLTAVSHAHNYLLQVLMEEGLIGALFILSAAALLMIASFRVLRLGTLDPWLAIIMIGVLAALIGRVVDQFGSVARISDLMLFFALAGFLVALTEVARAAKPSGADNAPRAPRSARRRERRPGFNVTAIIVAVIVGTLATLVFVSRDVAMLRAGWIAANGFESKAASDGYAAYLSFERAVDLAPAVERYALEQAGLIQRTVAVRQDPAEKTRLLNVAYEILARYEDRDPQAWRSQRLLASISLQLVNLGDTARIPEVIARYDNVATLMEAYPFVLAEVAEVNVQFGEMQQALDYSEQAIAGEKTTTPQPGAWWSKGSSLLSFGRTDEAIDAFTNAIAGNPKGYYARLSHLELGTIYFERGQHELADEHRRMAGLL
jgi:tetratricopeptide (TPR) repeat protein